MKQKYGFKFFGMCYDLIPVDYPHLVPDGYAPLIQEYLADLVWAADHIFCISETTKDDLLRFIDGQLIPAMPTMSVAYLGSEMASKGTSAGLPEQLTQQTFMLFVSTIERRKNHEVLYRAYLQILEKLGEETPLLVFVGMSGWNVQDLLKDLQNDPRLKDSLGGSRLLQLQQISDHQLTWLYQNCAFTLYPSLYEGWGLPIVESLTQGVPVISSTTPACVEASSGKTLLVDPWATNGWIEAITRLLKDPKELQKYKSLAAGYVPQTWDNFGQAITHKLDL